MRYASASTEDMPDGVAGAEPRAGDNPGHRHPGAHQAVQPRFHVARVGLHPRQPVAEQLQRLQARAVGVVVGIDGELGLDSVIHGADAGRKE